MSKKFYITTSIPYVNSPPHIGFALEIIQADVIARFHRVKKEDVFFLAGTDEHGQKIFEAAQKVKKNPLVFASEISEIFRKLNKVLNISNDDFIRTTDEKRHLPAVYKLWEKYKEKSDIYKKKYKGLYCVGCESFKLGRELVNNKCPFHPTKELEVVEEENYFFRLSKYLPQVKKIIEEDKLKIIPECRKNEILLMIYQGLGDISFSRSKNKYWGWPVPGDSSQNIYVWHDALANYLSGIGYGTNEKIFKRYWPADIHFIGKDIIKFHCIYWPAMLLSAGLALPKTIFVHGFITVGGEKLSKSLGNLVDPFVLVEKYGADSVRYFLLREIPSSEDGDFTEEKFIQRYNAELACGLGNFVSRVLGLFKKANPRRLTKKIKSRALIKETEETEKKLFKSLENFKFNEAISSVWDFIKYCDKYIEEKKLWETLQEQDLNDLFLGLEKIKDWIFPFLPETYEKLKDILITKRPEVLFPRVVDKK